MRKSLLSLRTVLQQSTTSPHRRRHLPPNNRPIHPIRRPRPRGMLPTSGVIFHERNMTTLHGTTRPQMRRAPPITPTTTTSISTRHVMPPNERLANKMTPNKGMRVRRVRPRQNTSTLHNRHPLHHRLGLRGLPYGPHPHLQYALHQTLLRRKGRHIPRPRLNTLIDRNVTNYPSIRPRNINTRHYPNVRLNTPPMRPLRDTTRRGTHRRTNTRRPRLPSEGQF